MKTIVNSVAKQVVKFPSLMRSSNGVIALFNSPTSGMILDSDDDFLGEYFDDSCSNDIIRYNTWTPLLPGESVTLTQK